ncbi:MAG: glutathione S-transferase family protein [Rhodospirillaceae bacterium]|jgi:glutathione S-transferase|nr:glutathione S-transferase family protein [Rhodospirillaceae bacterium]MBT5457730.1 glutathione S-transferase family protein [Rhodospirillaceae bacterium]
MPDEQIAVWGIGTPRTLRAHWILAEFGIDYDCHPITSRSGETMTPEFLALNPKHKIPVLQHGGNVLTESAAIVTYVSEAFAAPPDFHVPTDAVDRAKLNEWCFFIMTELDALSLYVIRKHQDLHAIYGEAPGAIEAAKNNFSDLTGALFDGAGGNQEFLLPEGLSVADILLTTCIQSAQRRGIEMPGYLVEFNDRMSRRPAFQKALAINNPG